MFDDDFDDEPPGAPGPLPPDDRLWRHPSEIGAALTPAPAAENGRPHRLRSLVLLAGVTTAVAAALAVVAVSTLTPTGDEDLGSPLLAGSRLTLTSSTTDSPSPKVVQGVSQRTAAALTWLAVDTDAATRHGSGVVVRADGAILTSAALVRDARSVTVTLADGRSAQGSVVGHDDATGVAVVRIDLAGLPVADLDSTTLAPGDPATLTGATASGDSPWTAAGWVSSVSGRASADDQLLAGLIETDRAVPPTGDGGALVAADGSVSGLCLHAEPVDDGAAKGNDAAAESADTPGYAVPIAVAAGVADDLITYGHARRAWLGVEADDLGAAEAEALGVPGGAVLTKVAADSPAEAAGLLLGDVVVAVADRPVTSMDGLIALLPLHRPAEEVVVTLFREGTKRTLRATLAERK